ncbi:hypothetical protein QOZ80_3BG0284560 [Eleusine coracana subsp. coracana]|nr:hypothetical protein QOZ80_3BG0284560 [Eleusine coracana subsp. coracana]
MSVANKEEVCTHPLVPRLVEPAVGVPIKKRPVSLFDNSAQSGTLPSMQSLSSAPEVPISAKHDANVITKEIDRSTAHIDELRNQKFSVLDLQLSSCRHGKSNYGSAVKKEKSDQCFSGFHSAQSHKNVQTASEINVSSNSFGKLPNLDLNVPPDPADSDEGLPAMYESSNGLCHGSIQHQNAESSAVSCGHNVDSLNLPNSYRPSRKCWPGDVTLDLQLKLPARPEIGKNWKGLTPAPELSLSLSGTPMALSAPSALFDSEPALTLKNVSEEAATLGSDKSTVEAVAPLRCKANPQNTLPTVTRSDKIASNNMVKKEPEEPSRQHILDKVEKKDSAPRVPDKTQFDLNSNIFPNSSLHNGLGIITDNVPIPGPSVPDTVPTEPMPVVPDKIQKSVKHEQSTSDVPSPVVAIVSGHAAPMSMAAKSLPLGINVPSHATGSCEASIKPPTSPLEPSFSNTVWKPPANHLNAHDDMARRPSDALQLQSSSNPIAEPLIHNNSRGYAANDGMSQGSAEMDCSDDDDNTAFRLPTARPQVGPSRNGPITEDGINVGNLSKELKKELDNDLHQDCSSVTNKVSISDVNDDKCVKIRDSIVSHSGEQEDQRVVFINEGSKENQSLKMDKTYTLNNTDNSMHDVKTATGSCSTDLQRSLALQNPASSKIGSTKKSPENLGSCPQKTRSLDIKSETNLSPHDKLAASSSEDFAKNAATKTAHGTQIEEVVNQSGVHPRDSVMESLGTDDASSSQPHSSCGRVKAASENSDEKSKPDSYMTSSVSNEVDGQLVGSHRRDLGYAYVNRNERWERFMESEREKAKGGYQDGRHGPDMINQRRTDYRNDGRGTGPRGYPRNFRGPRMSNESPFEDDPGHSHRIVHRRRHSPADVCRREMDIDGFPGREVSDRRLLAREQIEDLPDDMIQERFFRPHSHRHNAHDDRGFIQRERSHSPAQRRGAPVHFHRGRSPEAMHRSPPLLRTERTCLPHRRHTRRHGSPLDRIGHDERGMQRNMRRCGMIGSHRALEGDAFEPPLHPAHLAGLHAEEELMDRRKYRDRRVHRRSLEGPADDEMLSYHLEEEMEFAECGGPQEHDGRLRNRMGHRMRGEQEDSCRHRGPQGWRDVDSNDNRPKRRRY